MTVPADVDERGRAGRRERKKQRTREALIDAAFELFAEKGFEATTVEEIADAVDVSSRTFFRYFSSKEDVALTFQEEQFVAMREALAAQPPGDPVITALRKAAVGIARACEQGELGFDPARWMCLQNLMSTSPALLAGSLEHAQKSTSWPRARAAPSAPRQRPGPLAPRAARRSPKPSQRPSPCSRTASTTRPWPQSRPY